MIYVEMYGRLGNQMFRYAAARAIQEKFYPTEELCISFNQINQLSKNDPTFCNELSNFNIENVSIYNKAGKVLFNESNILQKLIATKYYLGLKKFKPIQMTEEHLYEMKWHNILNRYGLYWYRIGSIPIERSEEKNKFISGSFESPQYFSEIKNVLLKEFTPKEMPLKKNKELYSIIQNSESVCVSIRRGDFETNKKNKKIHSICNKEYFEKAIEKMNEILLKKGKTPTFILFSDDIEWAKKNINTIFPIFSEDGNDPVWEKLRMMYSCKHFILSNSTFSWWAQFLSQNTEKIVISPSKWFNNDYESPLINEKWIKIR